MFDLKLYTYDIFWIARHNNMDIGVGRDMFLANVRAGEHLYTGEHTVPDYAALKQEYFNSTDDEIMAALDDYDLFTRKNYKALTQMHVKEDIEGFKKLCGVEEEETLEEEDSEE